MQSPVNANGGRNEGPCIAAARETNLLTNFAAAIMSNPPEVPVQLLKTTSAVYSRVCESNAIFCSNFVKTKFLSR